MGRFAGVISIWCIVVSGCNFSDNALHGDMGSGPKLTNLAGPGDVISGKVFYLQDGTPTSGAMPVVGSLSVVSQIFASGLYDGTVV